MAEERAVGKGMRWLVWLFAAFGICGVLAIIFVAVTIFQMSHRWPDEPAPIVAKGASERFAVAGVEDVPGTDLAQIVIATEDSISAGRSSYSSAGPVNERNLLLLDKSGGASRKLLAGNDRRIVARYLLPAMVGTWQRDDGRYVVNDADGKEVIPPAAYYLLRVRTGEGVEDVLLGDLKTGRQDFVLKGIDGVDRIWMQTPTRLALLMRHGRKLQYRAFEVPELKLVATRAIEID